VAYNYKLSKEAMKKIANSDKSNIKTLRENYIEMNDATRYYIFSTHNHVRGHIIDQLIIVDDSRWEVYQQQAELIEWIKYRMCYSCVPEEYQIQEYEW